MSRILTLLDHLAARYEVAGETKLAGVAHALFERFADREITEEDGGSEPFSKTLEEILDMFPGSLIDVEGNWEKDAVVECEQLKESLPKEMLEARGAVDANHIVVLTPDGGLDVYNILDDDDLCRLGE